MRGAAGGRSVIAPPALLQASDREHVAVHEAGHAVVGIALGLQVVEATIVPGVNRYSRTIYGKEWGDPVRAIQVEKNRYRGQVTFGVRGRWKDHALCSLAGPLAEVELLSLALDTAWKADLAKARAHLGRTTAPKRIRAEWSIRSIQTNAWLRELFEECAGLVREHGASVRRVADALLEHETLDALGCAISGAAA
jgi:hypothetical protein